MKDIVKNILLVLLKGMQLVLEKVEQKLQLK